MAYTAVAMAVRYVDGTYVMPEGSLVAQVDPEFRPRFGNKGLESVFSPKSLVFVCMLSVAYLAHFSAPRFFAELKDNTMPRFNKVVSMSFGISILLMGLMTLLGFLTFGGNCAGVVLNNYAAKDLWISGSRIAVVVSLVFSYPLSFVGCRDGILDLIQASKEKRTPMVMNSLTLVMLVIVTFLACVLRDVKFVLASSGATLGNALTYVYPAIMYRSVVRNQGKGEHFGVALATFCAVLGIVMGAIGFKMSFK
jgi:amino acid permease